MENLTPEEIARLRARSERDQHEGWADRMARTGRSLQRDLWLNAHPDKTEDDFERLWRAHLQRKGIEGAEAELDEMRRLGAAGPEWRQILADTEE